MSDINDFFSGSNDQPSHPSLRDWKKRIDAGEVASVELYRPAVTIGLSPTKLIVQFAANGAQSPPDEVDWDEHLNRGLIRLKVRAVDPEQEAERFALGLRDGFRVVEKEFGNGYFNAVLLNLVVESKLDQCEEIADVLKFTYHDETKHQTRSYERCRDAIALAIGARAKELTGPLGYSQEEAKRILLRGVARYLDERFSVTGRRQMGLLSGGAR